MTTELIVVGLVVALDSDGVATEVVGQTTVPGTTTVEGVVTSMVVGWHLSSLQVETTIVVGNGQ